MSEQTKREIIENWLEIGFTQPAEKISEIFYFDKRDYEFFSILVSDYFLFDENLEIARDVTSNYPESILILLINRIKRIENKDKSIIALPRFGKLNGEVDKNISEEIDTFLNLNSINIDSTSIWEIDETGSVTINLKNYKKQKSWWKFWE
ncbi:hypothetical protein [Flavobacterium sp. N3904]|uniref:hypothetical protein n=1 Tax=Flavobacterium sp. N3904 TaxID=2986835 RepID=UPI0022242067|nr:hypothetical protein [Flavobacterium sp. N3904]